MASVAELKREGNKHFDAGDLTKAAACYREGVELFTAERKADASSIDTFAKIAGNLCTCLYQQGDTDGAFTAARAVLSTYPVIPKAYGVIGMCILDRLERQRAELEAAASSTADSTPETLRSDVRRYCVTMNGTECSADDAHTSLIRAVLLAPSLQVSLGPSVELAVRYVSHEMLSCATALERGHLLGGEGGTLLDVCAPAEQHVDPVPTLAAPFTQDLDTAPVMDAVTGRPTGERVPVPAEVKPSAPETGATAAAAALLSRMAQRPREFLFSGDTVKVRVCHNERGGLPRGLVLLRVETGVFAAANWITSEEEERERRTAGAVEVDPSELGLEGQDQEAQLKFMRMDPSSAEASVAPSPVCVQCRRAIPQHAPPLGCEVCGCARYCSPQCEQAHGERHRRYECELFQLLMRCVEESRAPSVDDSARAVYKEEEDSWKTPFFLQRVLPLCISCWGGLQTHAEGWELLHQQLLRPITRGQRTRIPAAVNAALDLLASSCRNDLSGDESFARKKGGKDKREGEEDGGGLLAVWQRLAIVVRLYASPGCAGEEGASLFFPQRLLLRHSCEPNCSWSETHRAIITTRFVFKGEELTMAADEHFPMNWPWQIRQRWWEVKHEVICQCTRCTREGRATNPARGELSTTLTELLLTADQLERPPATGARYKSLSEEQRKLLERFPTHFFHPRVQTAVLASQKKGADPAACAARLRDLRAELEPHVGPTHYLREDIRRALVALAAQAGESDTLSAEGKQSLLYLEAMWPGQTPEKCRAMSDIPTVYGSSRTRKAQHRVKRSERRKAAERLDSAGSAAPEYDYSQGTPVDLFFGSYQSWYYL